jgi:hypothetical protein
MEQELDRRQRDVALRRVDDTLGTVLEGGLEERDDIGGLVLQALGKLLAGGLQMVEVDVAIVLLGLDVLVNLVSFGLGQLRARWVCRQSRSPVYIDAVDLIFHNEADELILCSSTGVRARLATVLGKDGQSVDRFSIHGCGLVVLCD